MNIHSNISFHEIKPDCSKSISLLNKFYFDVYIENFPDENERETLDNLIRYLKNNKERKNNKNRYYILICTVNDEVAGGIISDYFEEINSIVIEFIVVSEKYRRNKIGVKLIKEMTKLINNNIDYIFIETENPNKVDSHIRPKATQTVNFWDRQGFLAVDFKYIQPRIDHNKNPIEHLFLGVKIYNPSLNKKNINSYLLKRFLYLYAKHAMSIKKPDEDETILKNYNNIFNDKVELKQICKYLQE